MVGKDAEGDGGAREEEVTDREASERHSQGDQRNRHYARELEEAVKALERRSAEQRELARQPDEEARTTRSADDRWQCKPREKRHPR